MFGAFSSRNFLFFVIAAIWIVVYVLWEKATGNRKRIKIYPLTVIYESTYLKKLIERSGRRHKKFWMKMGEIADKIFPALMVLAIIYITANFIALINRILIIAEGVPVGSEFVVVVPFLTVPPNEFLFLFLVAAIPAIFMHEFFHGAVSISEDIEVQSAGFFVLMGLVGGFVEPKIEEFMKTVNDIGSVQKRNKKTEASIFLFTQKKKEQVMVDLRRYAKKVRKVIAAGVLANLLLLGIFFGLYQGFTKLNLCRPYGLEIVKVEHGTPAEKYGLRVSDIMISINDTRVFTFEEFEKALQNAAPGDIVNIGVIREKKEITIMLVLADKNGRAYIGVGLRQYYKSGVAWIPDSIMLGLYLFVYLSFIIEFLIMILNVLPCFILDGSRWLGLYLFEKVPNRWRTINLITNIAVTTILLLNFIAPIFLQLIQ